MQKIYTNGTIITLDRRYSSAEAVVTEDGVITKVGDKSLLVNEKNYEFIDLNGSTLLPGFVVSCNQKEEDIIKMGITTVILNDAVQKLNKIDGYIYSHISNFSNEILNNCGKLMVLDGNLWEKKAYLSTPYHVVPEGELLSYSGIGNYKYIEIKKFISEAAKLGYSIKVIANGSAAIEQFLTAYEKLYSKLSNMRCVLSGCETASVNQIERMRMLNIIAEFPIWTIYRYGDYYIDSVIGESNFNTLSPLQTCSKCGVPFCFDIGDYSVLDTIQFSIQRRTRNNYLFNRFQRITQLRALRAVTLNGALAIGSAETIGSITPKKKADFVILSNNPCISKSGDISKIEVLETIKNGETIYKKTNYC